MCGRYTLASHDIKLPSLWTLGEEAANGEGATEVQVITGDDLRPMQWISVCRCVDGRIETATMRWGLIPSWAKDASIAKNAINARAETVAEKPTFRSSFKNRRAVVPTTGFYEWRRTPDGKRTKDRYHFTLASGEPFFMAALWNRWHSPDGEIIESASVITTAANDLIAPIHDRMPIMLTEEEAEVWMTANYDRARLESMLRPIHHSLMATKRSDMLVSNPTWANPVQQELDL